MLPLCGVGHLEARMLLSNIFNAVAMVFSIAFLGFLLKRKGWIDPDTARALPRFITTIVIPPFLLRSAMMTFSHDQLPTLLRGAVVPLLSIFLCFGIAWALSILCNVTPGRRGVFRAALPASNTVNIGIPINVALFGEDALQYVLLYMFANSLFFWSLGNYCIAHDGDGKDVRIFSLRTLKQIFSPPFTGFVIGLALVAFDLSLPAFIDKAFKYIGEMTVGLCILYIGILLHDTKLRDFKPEKDTMLVFIGRFILSPLTIVLLSLVFTVPDAMLKVFIVQSSLPVMLNTAILTAYYKGDARYAAIIVSVSTMMIVLTVPLTALFIAAYFS